MNPSTGPDTIENARTREWKRGKRRLLLLWVLALAIGALVVYLNIIDRAPSADREGKRGSQGSQDVLPVAAQESATADIDVTLKGLGTVTPLHTVTVRTQVDGQMLRVAFEEGQIVKAGQLLAEIDPRPFQVQLMQAEGQLMRDQALLKNAKIDLARYKTLLAQDSIAEQQVITQEALVRQYQGDVETDRGQIASAKLQLTYARIVAPVAGRVGLRRVDPGNLVQTSDANGLLVITQLQPMAVVFTLPEDELPAVMKRLRAGERLPTEAYDRADRFLLASGTLLAVDNQIDVTTGTVKLKAQFANQDNALFPNQFVNIKMKVDTLRGVTVIPTAAVQRGIPGTFVYLVKADHTVSVRPVKLGPSQGEKVAVLEGLTPRELIVVDGADKLREGSQIGVVRREAGAVPTGAAQGLTEAINPGHREAAGAAE